MQWFRYAIVGLPLLMGVAALCSGLVRYDVVRGALDSLAGDGSADPYTRALHQRLGQVAVATGLTLIASSIVLWLNRGRLFGRGGSMLRSGRQRCVRTVRLLRALVRGNWKWIFRLTVLGGLLRLPYLFQPIRFDEAYTFLRFSQYPWFVGISLYEDPNNHVFHTLCVRIFSQLFGEEPWVLRLPAWIAGVLTVPATFLAARIQGGRAAGIIAGCIVASSSVLIEYSTNARGYTIVCLCSVLALLAASMLERELAGHGGKGLHWPMLVLASVIGLWTIPVMAYPLVIVWSWILMTGWRICAASGRLQFLHAWCASGLATGGAVLLLYAPVLIVSGWQRLTSHRYIRPLQWDEFFERVPAAVAESFELLSRDWPLIAQLLFAVGLGRWLFSRLANHRAERRWRVALVSGLLCVGVVFLQRVTPPSRVWTFLVPLLAVPGAVGLADLATRMNAGSKRVAVLALLLFVVWPAAHQARSRSVLQSQETGACPDAEEIVLFLKDRFHSDSASGNPIPFIAVAPVSSPVAYYARRHGLSAAHFQNPDRQSILRSVVLVSRTQDQSVRDVLAGLGLDQASADSFQTLKTFPTVRLYRRDVSLGRLPATDDTATPGD